MPVEITALQLARCLGCSKQAVAKAMAGRAGISRIIEGKETLVWSVEVLPHRYLRKLNVIQSRGGYRSLQDLIDNPPRREFPVSASDVSAETLLKAERLREALLPFLERKDNPLMGATDAARAGVDAYTRLVGHSISERQWRAIFRRAIDRDAGFEDWNRIELYLDERSAAPAAAPTPTSRQPVPAGLESLALTLGGIRDRANPTTPEVDAVWIAVVELLQPLHGAATFKRTKRTVIQYLLNEAPWIGKTPAAIDRNIRRKLEKTEAAVDPAIALRDGRSVRAEIRSSEELWPKEDVDLITYMATARHGGRVAEAIRAAAIGNQLSEESARRLVGISRSKSYVPESLRRVVSHRVQAYMPFQQGPRAARLVTPHIDRDYSKVVSMEVVQADDFTMPVYFWHTDSSGVPQLTRGQVLIAIDLRSLRVLSFVLIPAKQYTALAIRTLFAKTFEQHGIPRRLYLENGIWKRAALVAGDSRLRSSETNGPSLAEMQMGQRGLGIEFTHAQRPQAKVIEKIGDLIQTRMHAVPGYCGRDERRDCPEITRRNIQAVQAGRCHPGEHFLGMDEWVKRLQSIMHAYNSERHDASSKVIPGLTPDEAFEKFWKEPVRFGPEARHLLATVRIPVTCTQAGIKFQVGGATFRLFDAQTGDRIHQPLLAWWNPELPDTCTFTDLNGRNAFTCERHVPVAAAGDDPRLPVELGRARAHTAASKSQYRVLKARFEQRFQTPLVDRATAKLGEHMEGAAVVAKTRNEVESHRGNRIEKLVRETGIATPIRSAGAEEDLKGLAELFKGVTPTKVKGYS